MALLFNDSWILNPTDKTLKYYFCKVVREDLFLIAVKKESIKEGTRRKDKDNPNTTPPLLQISILQVTSAEEEEGLLL